MRVTEWKKSLQIAIFKNKGDVQTCNNYRSIKLISLTIKIWERVMEGRIRKWVRISEQQCGIIPRKSTPDAGFALRMLIEEYRGGQKKLNCLCRF